MVESVRRRARTENRLNLLVCTLARNASPPVLEYIVSDLIKS